MQSCRLYSFGHAVGARAASSASVFGQPDRTVRHFARRQSHVSAAAGDREQSSQEPLRIRRTPAENEAEYRAGIDKYLDPFDKDRFQQLQAKPQSFRFENPPKDHDKFKLSPVPRGGEISGDTRLNSYQHDQQEEKLERRQTYLRTKTFKAKDRRIRGAPPPEEPAIERPEPEPAPVYETTPTELRALLEKRRFYAQKGAEWDQRRSKIGWGTTYQVSQHNDVRLKPRHKKAKVWTHDEIWNLILEDGKSYNPAGHQMQVYDPLSKADYFSEGSPYTDDFVDWLKKEGRLWDRSEGPDMRQELDMAMLESEFADILSTSDPADDEDADEKEELDDEDLKGSSIQSTGA